VDGHLLKARGSFETTFDDGDGKRPLTVPNLQWLECDRCGEVVLDDAAANAIDSAKYESLGLLAPQSILALRQRFGKTQEQMADLLGVGRKTYCRWENGTYFQTRANDNYLRLVSWLLDKFTNPIPILEGLRAPTPESLKNSGLEILREKDTKDTVDFFDPNLRQHRSSRCCQAKEYQCL
jgi:DNA-binding transcriptional regulator YiaG